MAKKAGEATIEGFTTKRPDRLTGWKSCPSCGGFVRGGRTPVCPNCKHVFVAKSRVVARPKASFSGGNPSPLETDNKIMLTALKVGGVDKLSAALTKLADDPVISLAIELGGLNKAQQAVEALGTRIKNG